MFGEESVSENLMLHFRNSLPGICPQGITGFDSFPSGHAAMGFMLLSILILLVNAKRWLKNSVLTIILLYGIVLALSRVVIGAHYASDVLFGSFFIILAFIVFLVNLSCSIIHKWIANLILLIH